MMYFGSVKMKEFKRENKRGVKCTTIPLVGMHVRIEN